MLRGPGPLAVSVLIALAAPALAQGGPPAAPPGAAASAPSDPAAKPARPPRGKEGQAGSRREPTAGQLAGRERTRKCGAEWRALSASAKAEAGPKWPQFLSKCVKRLKEQKA